jgi:hypothetical protein
MLRTNSAGRSESLVVRIGSAASKKRHKWSQSAITSTDRIRPGEKVCLLGPVQKKLHQSSCLSSIRTRTNISDMMPLTSMIFVSVFQRQLTWESVWEVTFETPTAILRSPVVANAISREAIDLQLRLGFLIRFLLYLIWCGYAQYSLRGLANVCSCQERVSDKNAFRRLNPRFTVEQSFLVTERTVWRRKSLWDDENGFLVAEELLSGQVRCCKEFTFCECWMMFV